MHHAAFCLQQLKSCELFRELNDLELNDLYASMVRVKLEPGEGLVVQGEISDCMYVLLSGRLLVQVDGRTIGQIGRGQTVGEMGLITHEPRSASVIAMRESLLLKLDQTSFTELWTRHPSVLFEVTKIITQRLQKTLKVRQRYNNASNIVVLQANQRVDMKLFFEELSASFDQRFRYRILRRSDFPQTLSEEQFHQQVRDLEHHYDYLFYEIGSQQDEWRELCLGNADRILVLGDGSRAANYDPEIHSVLTGGKVHQEIKKILVLLHGEFAQPKDTLAWLQPIQFFRHYHVRLNRREDFSRLLRLLNGTAIGLVLGGGGTRSWAQVGVMKYVYEQKIPIDAYAGTSAGSMNAASLAIARDYDDYLKIGRQLAKCVSFKEYTIPLCSILSSKSLTSALKEAFGETRIEDLEKLVICVAGDLFKSTEVDIQEGLLWLAVRASLSLPGIYPPVYAQGSGQLLVDGGVVNNLPVDVMRNYFEGFGKIISVDISDVRNSITDYNYPMELTWQTILREKYFSRPCTLNIPSITNTFMQGLMLSTDQKANANALLSNINIKPSLAGFALLDSSRNDELIDIGYAYAQKNLANWREDLNLSEITYT